MTDRVPAALARQVTGRGEITIRSARGTDARDVARLAHLLDRQVPPGPLLVADSDGTAVAALCTTTGTVLHDPFRVSTDLVDLLRLRARQLEQIAA
jgi:hypothetical protein